MKRKANGSVKATTKRVPNATATLFVAKESNTTSRDHKAAMKLNQNKYVLSYVMKDGSCSI